MAVAILGGYLTIKDVIEVGDIQSFIQYVRNFTQPLQQIAQVANMLQSTAAASERVFEFLEGPEEDQTVENPVSVENLQEMLNLSMYVLDIMKIRSSLMTSQRM